MQNTNKIFLSHKLTGLPPEELKSNLTNIREKLNNLGFDNFIYYLDADTTLPAKQVGEIFFNELKSSDIFIGLINHEDKSEGQLLEIGAAWAMDKKKYFLVNNKYKSNYFMIDGIPNSEILYFDNLYEIDFNFLK